MPTQKNPGANRTDSTFKDLPKPQKNAVILLAAAAVFVIVFWVWQMQAHIKGPFNYQVASSSGTSTAETDYINLLKNTDTDHDGLSDYDEIYVYHTSPYLADTNSDGISDKDSIARGIDPVCPKGQNCSGSLDTSHVAANSTASSTTTASSSLNALNPATADETALKNALNGQSDAATLRQLLISSGASATDLNKISDADLMKSYQETLQSQSQSQVQSQ